MARADTCNKCGRPGIPGKYICSECRSKRRRELWKERSGAPELAAQKRNREKRVRFLRNLKETTPCTDCGMYFPHWLVEHDHRNGAPKDRRRYINCSISLTAIKEELPKCDLVCANCHKHRTYCRREGIPWYPAPKASPACPEAER